MALGTKNRQKQTADICKQHLREKYPDKLGLVEEFIVEIEGPPKNCDVTRWGQFTDIKDIKKEMLQRLDASKTPPLSSEPCLTYCVESQDTLPLRRKTIKTRRKTVLGYASV